MSTQFLLTEIKKDLEEAAKGLITEGMKRRAQQWANDLSTQSPTIFNVISGLFDAQDPQVLIKALTPFVPELKQHSHNPFVVKYVKLLQDTVKGGA